MKDELKSRFNIFMAILDLIETSQNEDGISNISQKELSSRLSISPTNVSNRLKILAKYNAIVKVAPGAYRLLHNDINYTPYPNVVKVVELLEGDPSLIGKYKKQAELLGLEINEVQQAWGYIYDLILKKV
ncbi:winged helix-turn-helix transcriptional regulator [Peribacillus sp. NPDC056705]|uniref:winged helix-turn-helix transcriptional regulator n=1 Tax=Peribacillus sp. NPDC056705 TaxID=3345918 RepID=UPI003747D914